MRRTIERLDQDADGEWVASLDCGHRRHVRHDPPRVQHDWLLDAGGRRDAIGRGIECGSCARRVWPEDVRPYKRTPEFDAASVPAGLRARHTTKRGVWARIHVLAGRLRYRIHEPFAIEEIIEPGATGVVLPEVPHEVEPVDSVRFFVEFHRVP
jgi:tellurite methyltransferase